MSSDASVGKAKSFLDFEGDDQKQKTYLAVFGILIVLTVSVTGYMLSAMIFVNESMAIVGGLTAVIFTMSILGYLTVIINRAISKVTIKIVKETE